MAVTKIAPSTPIREFPDIYNRNVDELVDEIDRLRGLLAEKDTEIDNIVSSMNSALNRFRAEYIAMLDPDKVSDENGNYILKAKRTNNGIEYNWATDEIPNIPEENGTYILKVTKTNDGIEYNWTPEI